MASTTSFTWNTMQNDENNKLKVGVMEFGDIKSVVLPGPYPPVFGSYPQVFMKTETNSRMLESFEITHKDEVALIKTVVLFLQWLYS